MKKHHTTIVLMILFFTGLIVIWWAPYAGIPTAEQRLEREKRILPELLGVKPVEIRRVEIDRSGKDRLAFERRDPGRWQMVEPVDVAADASRVETLVRNLTELRKSTDAGTIHQPPAPFGLASPAETVRLFAADATAPLATLEFGTTARDLRYVRSSDVSGIEVVDARLFQGLGAPAADWRDRAVFNLASFQVAALTVAGPGRDLKVERVEGRWTLVRPLQAPADDEKVEGTVAELVSLRVADGDKGFIANDVKDFAPYGLDEKSAIAITLQPTSGAARPQVLLVGKAAPDQEDRRFARRGDQDDVILVDDKGLRDLGTTPNALRSQKVADINPRRVDSIRIETPGLVFSLVHTPTGWDLAEPVRQKADAPSVQALLNGLSTLQTSEFLEPSRVDNPGLDPPQMTLVVAQDEGSRGKSTFTLRLGRHDVLRKTVYARVEGDPTGTILALPDNILDILPKNALAYRDRSLSTVSPSQVVRLTIRREGRTIDLAPAGPSGLPNRWRMLAPVEAPADDEAVTTALLALSGLRAESLVTDQPGDPKAFGLDAPGLSVSWTTPPEPSSSRSRDPGQGPAGPRTTTLQVGSREPRSESRYARLAGDPLIFTLNPATLVPFVEAEFHTHRVLSFPSKQAERLVLRRPGRMLAFVRRPAARSGATQWRPEPGVDASGFDLSRLDRLVSDLSGLKTRKFIQYAGPIPVATGLSAPTLTIQVHLGGSSGASPELRVGKVRDDGALYATTATGAEGPVFLLSGPSWLDLVRQGGASDELPADVFAPASPTKPPG